MSFRIRLISILALLVLIPAVILSVIYQARAVSIELFNSLIYSVEQTAVIIQNELGEIRLIADSLSENPTLKEYMSVDGHTQTKNQQIDEHNDLAAIILPVSRGDSIYGIRLFFKKYKFYTAENITYFDYSSSSGLRHLQNASVKGSFTGKYRQQYKDRADADVLSFIRMINEKGSVVRTVGALAVDIDAEYLRGVLLSQEQPRFSHMSIVERDGDVVISSVKDLSFVRLPERIPEEGYINENGVTTALYRIDNTEWVLVGELDSGNFESVFTGMNGLYGAVFAGVLILTAIFAVLYFFAHKVDAIVAVLDTGGETDGKPGVFRRLTRSAAQAEKLEVQRQQALIFKQQMQMRLMQAQINPHMLYNILDTTNWLIKNSETEKASRLVEGIAQYYRLALSGGSDAITVQKDLELAVVYAALQEVRLHKKITIDYVMEDEAKQCLIPKMTLQPLIENSISHGFSGLVETPRIDIDIYLQEQAIVICVSDNGAGFDTSKLPGLLSGENGGKGFGLYNVHSRARLFSESGGYGLSAESEIGKFTTITVQIKKRP